MSDRRTHQYPVPSNAAYNAAHLTSGQYQQLAYAEQYSSPSYPSTYSPARPHSVVGATYDQSAAQAHAMSGHSGYHLADPQMNYTYSSRPDRPVSMSMHQPPAYQTDSHHGMMTHPSTRVSTHSHSPSRPRSAHPYTIQPSSPPHSPSIPTHTSAAYPGQVAYAQHVPASQYPASPQRPFSGEKPFVCNGGCGKTFTRKDALKRHQLVKKCGIDEDTA